MRLFFRNIRPPSSATVRALCERYCAIDAKVFEPFNRAQNEVFGLNDAGRVHLLDCHLFRRE